MNMIYYWNLILSGSIQRLKEIIDAFLSDSLNKYEIEYTIEIPDEIKYETNPIDGNSFSDFSHPGHINFFICDFNNFKVFCFGSINKFI